MADRAARREGMAHVRDALDRVLRHLKAPSAREVASVFTLWPTLVGPQMAAHTSVVSLREGELLIAVDDPAWAAELRWLEPELLERLARELGTSSVRSIRFRVARSR